MVLRIVFFGGGVAVSEIKKRPFVFCYFGCQIIITFFFVIYFVIIIY